MYCSYSRTHNIQNGFLHFLPLFICEVNIVAEQKQTYCWRTFCFLKACISRNAYCPLP